MEIPAGGKGGREDDAGGVDGLPDVAQVDAARNFFDEDGGEPLGAEFFVYA